MEEVGVSHGTTDNVCLHAAILMALKYHGKQEDKAGQLYVLHPLHVMLQMDQLDEKIVAVLHDILEDTTCTIEKLQENFPQQIVDAVIALTRNKGIPYEDYLKRVKENPLALSVKLKDIEHNSSEKRLFRLSYSEQSYLSQKYKKAIKILTS